MAAKSEQIHLHPSASQVAYDEDVPFGSNAMRLDIRQWVIVTVILLLIVGLTPMLWKQFEPLNGADDYRIPYSLSNDYWIYDRVSNSATSENKIFVIGDSVIWGEYVSPDQTFSHHLNDLDGGSRFVNGGANGTHPLALEGLVRDYAAGLTDVMAILHCNLLWMSSPDRDLQVDKELSFNHPRLVPQFFPWIPCYRASIAERMGNVVDNYCSFRGWIHHLRIAYFDGQSIPDWTIEHPLENPLQQITLELPPPARKPHSRGIPWTERKIPAQDLPWIDLDTSLQWRAFGNTLRRLRARGNRVFVILGPFNEHMLTDESRRQYQSLRADVEAWLREHNVASIVPEALPSADYADASHPLSEGYARMAERVYTSPEFQQWFEPVEKQSAAP